LVLDRFEHPRQRDGKRDEGAVSDFVTLSVVPGERLRVAICRERKLDASL
jgi:hypothetical protein